MSLYNDLTDVLTPYANKIKEVNESLDYCFNTETPAVTFTSGKAVVASTSSSAFGGVSNSSVLSYSNYIAIKGARFIDISFPTYVSATTFGAVFYDSSKNPIQGIVIEETGVLASVMKRLVVPDGAVSMRTSYFTDTATYGDFYIKVYKSFDSNWNPSVVFTSSKGLIATPSDSHFGELGASTALKVTNYITLDRNIYNSIELTMPIYASSTNFGTVFFDENKSPISSHLISATGTQGTEKRTLPIPYTAKYVRTCYWMDESTYGEFSIRCLNAPQRDGLDVHVYPASMSAACEGMGYVCTGTNDEKVIQKAVNEVARLGCGRVLLAPGIYYIDGFYSAGDGDISSAICMPSDYNKITIICEQGDPRLIVDNNYINASKQCAVLRITSAAYESVDTVVSVIRSYKYDTTTRKSALNIENIAISLPNNQKPIICIDGKNATHMMLDNVKMCAISGGEYTRPVENCIGVRGMQGSNAGTCDRWDNLSAYGFREGFAVSGEHLVCTNLLGRKCFYGYTFNNYTNGLGAWLHPITMINCADELNENMPLFGHNGESGQTDSLGGRQAISMIDFNIEWISSNWQSDSGIRATEIMPGEWYGNINYTIQPSYGGNTKNAVNIPFWASGSGVNVKTINDAQKQIVTTSERTSYAANNMQRVYDTDTEKFYTYVNGTWIEE